MHTRIRLIADTYTRGRLKDFADLMGWTPQYVTNMVSGRASIGLTPVVAILRKFPKVDARWLLLGEGAMFKPDIVERTKKNLQLLIEFEKYVPFMTVEELKEYNAGRTDFPEKTVEKWDEACKMLAKDNAR